MYVQTDLFTPEAHTDSPYCKTVYYIYGRGPAEFKNKTVNILYFG